MPVSAQASGTQTAVIGTEHVLASVSAIGTFTLHVDMINLAAGDILELRLYQMVLTGGTERVCYYQRIDGVQPADGMIWISVPISNELSDATALKFTLKQTAGTGRNIPWKILKYA